MLTEQNFGCLCCVDDKHDDNIALRGKFGRTAVRYATCPGEGFACARPNVERVCRKTFLDQSAGDAHTY